LLADSSGSMSSPAAGATRWKFVTDALLQILPHLPPDDVVSVGSFAESLQWWVEGKPVREAATIPLPPATAYPHGPTNLQPALEAIARSADRTMPVQLLVLSDFDTQVTNPQELAALLKSKNIRLHLLAIGEGAALPALRQIAVATGGRVVTEIDPSLWANSARELARQAGSKLLEHDPITIMPVDGTSTMRTQSESAWNRTWLKESATKMAEAHRGSETLPMAARWNAGEGRVLAMAFDPPAGSLDKWVGLVARPPHDPRFHVAWTTGATLRVVVDATSERSYLNGQPLLLDFSPALTDQTAAPRAIPQSGPGRYELAIPAPRSPCVATVRLAGRVIDRTAVAGRYAPEFDALGNDHAAMRELASRSGGEVIPPNRNKPLDIRWPARHVPLTSPLAAMGALCIAIGLVWSRID
jgi:hypothetical protein